MITCTVWRFWVATTAAAEWPCSLRLSWQVCTRISSEDRHDEVSVGFGCHAYVRIHSPAAAFRSPFVAGEHGQADHREGHRPEDRMGESSPDVHNRGPRRGQGGNVADRRACPDAHGSERLDENDDQAR